jgi:hypothetical protein
MSNKVLWWYCYIEDVLTDLDAVPTLQDSATPATYGVKRDDTGDVIVLPGWAMTRIAKGTYKYDHTSDYATDKPHTYVVRYLYTVGSVQTIGYFTDTFTVAAAAADVQLATPASMIAEMKIQFGATDSGNTDRQTMIANCVRRARDYVWNYCLWDWRHVVYPLVTVKDQKYTTLPTDYSRVAQWGDWLVGAADATKRPQYVPPEEFERVGALDGLTTAADPTYFTIGNETISTVWTPVVRWKGTPTGVKTYDGFHYCKTTPTWTSTGTTAPFEDAKWDILWAEAASNLIMSRLRPVEQGVVIAFPSEALGKLMEDARAKYEWHPPGAITAASSAVTSAASMIAEMKIQFGALDAGNINKATIIENCVRRARDWVWNYSLWDWRHVVYPLVTVKDQTYTPLPTNYCRVARWGDWLVGAADATKRPQFVPPEDFERMGALGGLTTGADPTYFTIGNETISAVWTPVVRWKATPNAVKTYDGFHYFKAAPTWSATATTAVFEDGKWDVLWAEAASNLIMARLTPVQQATQAVFPSPSLVKLMEDARLHYEWHPPGAITTSPSALTSPASMIAEMEIQFGALETGNINKATLIENCVRRARDYVWNYCLWRWRHVVYPLVTVANQAYTTLPTNYSRVGTWGDWLVESTGLLERPRYVSPEDFERMGALDNLLTETYPTYFTIGSETILTVWTPVIRWMGTPTAVYTYNGFHYFKAAPTWSATATSALFEDGKWDVLWAEACTALIMSRLKPVEQGIRILFPPRTLVDLMEDARAKYEWHPPSNIGQDRLGDTDDLIYGYSTTEPDYDSTGNLLLPEW